MSISGIDLLVPPGPERMREQEFERVRGGFDPDQVHEYLLRVADVVESLEGDLREARAERDSLRHRLAKVREEAYEQLASRMAAVLGAADQEADKVRTEAAQETARQISDARQESERMRREAQADVARIRREGEQVLRTVRAEVEGIVGGLVVRRASLLTELRDMRQRLAVVIAQLTEVADAPDVPPGAAGWPGNGHVAAADSVGELDLRDPQVDELLSSAEGFDLILPDSLGDDDPE
jgi:cell division septum initiation protein DivIVA